MNDFLFNSPLSLHHLTALEASPVELVQIAARVGCTHVSLFTNVPQRARHIYPCVNRIDIPAVAAALSAAGVQLHNLEVFPLDRPGELEGFEEGLEIGSMLGATRATAHIHATNPDQAVSLFSAFALYAASFGIVAGLEFNAFSAVKDVATAAAIVRAAGAGSLVLDTLHLMRSGGGLADVAEVADLVGYCQLSDGPELLGNAERWHEAISERALPGESAFPLVALVQQLDCETMMEIEVPQDAARAAGANAQERAARATIAAQRVLRQARG